MLILSLLLLIVGVLIGRRGYGSIAEWGRMCERKAPEVVDSLGFAPGRTPRTPAAATLFRLVRDLHGRAFQAALQGWVVATAAALQIAGPTWEHPSAPDDQITLDGKTVRGASRRRGSSDFEKTGLHAVAAEVASGWPGLAESRPARFQVSQIRVSMEPKAAHLRLALLIRPERLAFAALIRRRHAG